MELLSEYDIMKTLILSCLRGKTQNFHINITVSWSDERNRGKLYEQNRRKIENIF